MRKPEVKKAPRETKENESTKLKQNYSRNVENGGNVIVNVLYIFLNKILLLYKKGDKADLKLPPNNTA